MRRWDGWHRHVTLCLLAHAVLAVTRAVAEKGVLPPTVPEVRRLLLIALLSADEAERTFRLGWSTWRRRHQARARRSHSGRRLAGPSPRAPPRNSTV